MSLSGKGSGAEYIIRQITDLQQRDSHTPGGLCKFGVAKRIAQEVWLTKARKTQTNVRDRKSQRVIFSQPVPQILLLLVLLAGAVLGPFTSRSQQ